MKLVLTLTAFLALSAAPAAMSQNLGPAETVQAFYKYSNARSSIFNKRHIELRKRWYTPELYSEFLKELDEEVAHLKSNPTDKPFFGDGLDFRPLDEPCVEGERSYRRIQSIGRTEINRSVANVEVRFAYPKACTSITESISYRVNLKKVGGRWLIADWTYPDGSTLIADMRRHKYN